MPLTLNGYQVMYLNDPELPASCQWICDAFFHRGQGRTFVLIFSSILEALKSPGNLFDCEDHYTKSSKALHQTDVEMAAWKLIGQIWSEVSGKTNVGDNFHVYVGGVGARHDISVRVLTTMDEALRKKAVSYMEGLFRVPNPPKSLKEAQEFGRRPTVAVSTHKVATCRGCGATNDYVDSDNYVCWSCRTL